MAVGVWNAPASTWGTFTWGGGNTALRPHGRMVLELYVDAAPVDVCVVGLANHAAVLADGWMQQDTLTAQVRTPTLPGGLAYGTVVTLQQTSGTDPTSPLVGPFGRYRMVGVAAPEQPQDRHHYVNLEARDWLRALLSRAYTTSGITGVNAPVAAIQLCDMLRGEITGAVAADPDFVTWAEAVWNDPSVPERADASWWETWEAIVAAVLWYVSGSTLADPWIAVDGALRDLTNTPHFVIPRTDVVTGLPLDRWDVWTRMTYDTSTAWYTLLTELCAPKVPGRTSFGLDPLTATYDADGVLHLRRARERWSQGWGWKPSATDTAHSVPLILPVRTYSTRQREPQYDRVTVTMLFLEPSLTITIAADLKAATSWYTWDATLERPYVENLSLGGIVGQSNGTNPQLSEVSAADLYVVQIADAILTRSLSEANEVQLQLTRPWYYPQLGQDVRLYDPVAGLAWGTTLWQATTPWDGSGGSYTTRFRCDL